MSNRIIFTKKKPTCRLTLAKIHADMVRAIGYEFVVVSRRRKFTVPRFMFIRIALWENHSYSAIGKFLMGNDYRTVRNGLETLSDLIETRADELVKLISKMPENYKLYFTHVSPEVARTIALPVMSFNSLQLKNK